MFLEAGKFAETTVQEPFNKLFFSLTRYTRAHSLPVERLDRENSTSASALSNTRCGVCCSHLILDLRPTAVCTQFPLSCTQVGFLRSLWVPPLIWKLYMMPDPLYCEWKIVFLCRCWPGATAVHWVHCFGMVFQRMWLFWDKLILIWVRTRYRMLSFLCRQWA